MKKLKRKEEAGEERRQGKILLLNFFIKKC